MGSNGISDWIYPLVMTNIYNIAIEAMAIEIVDLASYKLVDFP